MTPFKLVSQMVPMGDQPAAIVELTRRIQAGESHSTLLGVTGSGKTFTMAHVIQNLGRPALIISHNKTLAAQLYAEFKDFFPHNAVHYFVSYYDYYQPEAYIPQRDIYIEKDAGINEDLDRLRLAATSSLMSRRDVIIVASVSAIFGLGSPEDYMRMIVTVKKGETLDRRKFFGRLVDIQYERNEIAFTRGHYRVRGDVFEILPSYEETGIRVEFLGDQIQRISEIHPTSGGVVREVEEYTIYPAKHFVMPDEKINQALQSIHEELYARLKELRDQGRMVEADRLAARTKYDLEMMQEVGYCKGIENYSRHLSGRLPGQRPSTLIDYFPKDHLVIVDESHVTTPQLRGMYNGDRSRKETLVEYGFRLPSALDNRPMRFDEWEASVRQVVFVSATPGPYEIKMSKGEVVEQVIRPTGLIDPFIQVKPARNQVQDLLIEIRKRVDKNERVLVTTLTKKLAEDLSQYLQEEEIKGCYLHSEVQTFERVKILNDLRAGKVSVLVGVNLLREGLDLPEVTLVAILDADKEGFLRSATSIIQTIGRTARNVNGEVILYADKMTDSMKYAIDETERRRKLQLEYNEKYGITPKTIEKAIRKGIGEIVAARDHTRRIVHMNEEEFDQGEAVAELEKEMLDAAERLEFERAAELRDEIQSLTGEVRPATVRTKRKFKMR